MRNLIGRRVTIKANDLTVKKSLRGRSAIVIEETKSHLKLKIDGAEGEWFAFHSQVRQGGAA